MRPPANTPARRQRGFTLVEAIMVMVITGVLAGILVLFIRQPVQNYMDASGRAEMSDQADLALRRMARELRGALPNSVREQVVGGASLIEFIPTKIGGRYLSIEDNANAALPVLDFQTVANTFTVDGAMPVGVSAIVAGDDMVVYNLGSGYLDADAYAGSNRARVLAVAGNTVTLLANTFSVPALATPARLPNTSPSQRFQVVQQPVLFVCQGNAAATGTLTRFWNYGFQAAMPVAGAGQSAVLARNVVSCTFRYTNQPNVHTGLIGLTIVLGRPNSTERITLAHQIHVENTP
ncbi:type II secretion system protein [Rugamonas sp. CCM 8940]|uniref:type II secretion system protein n=1 Tax=Rugamonas sp. CCM 8940 TaxID=2765359 RepID=UPI0018F644B4|nr:type II secretion system protein [Rugamonas sp. CCM 8940]MBJ7313584.1 type II secretion system protein [Rugamonas sp. CCM 8940]